MICRCCFGNALDLKRDIMLLVMLVAFVELMELIGWLFTITNIQSLTHSLIHSLVNTKHLKLIKFIPILKFIILQYLQLYQIEFLPVLPQIILGQ